MSAVGITENVKGDVKKFEIWYSGREVVYIVQVFAFLLSIFLYFIAVSFSVWILSHTLLVSCSVLCSVCVCLGSHSRGESYMADGDS